MADVPYIWFRGKRMTRAFRDAILAAEQRAGFQFVLTQGGFNAGGVAASAGTHDGDAGDWSIRGLNRDQVAAMIEALRWAGIAAWLRTGSAPLWETRAQGFSSAHVHGVPNGWGLPSAGARSQAAAYRRGRDGLRANLADIGPGHVKTWYSQTTPRKPITLPTTGGTTTTPKDWYDMADKQDLKDAVNEVLWEHVVPGNEGHLTASSWRNNVLHIQNKLDRILAMLGNPDSFRKAMVDAMRAELAARPNATAEEIAESVAAKLVDGVEVTVAAKQG